MTTKHFFRQLSSFGPFVECKREDEGAIEFVPAPSHAASTEPVSNFTATQAAQLTDMESLLISRNDFYDDPVEDIAHSLAHELEDAELSPNDYVTVNREKLKAIAKRVFDKALSLAAIDAAILANQSQKG